MKNYETVFILNPALSEEQVQKTVDKYEKSLKSNGAKIISKEVWGLKKLAYTIENKNSGFYNLLEYTAPAELVSSIELDFTRDETVMRYLTVTLDKHAIAWAEKASDLFRSIKCREGEMASLETVVQVCLLLSSVLHARCRFAGT